MNGKLPELPVGTRGSLVGDWITLYTADQMREYARAAIELNRKTGFGVDASDSHRLVESHEKISEHVTVLHLTEAGRKAITVDRDVNIPGVEKCPPSA